MEKVITLSKLKELEQEEYQTLKTLHECKLDHLKRGEINTVRSIESTISYQRGKWAMLVDLIEMLEDGEED